MTETAKKIDLTGATLYNARMEDILPTLRFDHVFTDPPYLYLKGHDFDREFDEALLFETMKRIMPDSGFSALFGRGTSFYRWNTRLAELGFVFKDEIIWDKRYTTAPCIALSRVHETVSLYTRKTGKIRRVKVPYIEQKQFDLEGVVNDVKRIKGRVKTETGLNKILEFLQNGELYKYKAVDKHCVSQQPGIKKPDKSVAIINAVKNGMNEKSIICCDSEDKAKTDEDVLFHKKGITVSERLRDAPRDLKIIRSFSGMSEKTIITAPSDHYNYFHPTQKPVRLAERVIALISDPGDTVCDPFMGSGSFGMACVNTGRKYIGIETDEGYFNTAAKRIKEALSENLFAFQEGDGND